MAVLWSTMISCFFAVVTYNYSYEIATAYTEDMDVVALLTTCLESLALSHAICGFNLSLQGALKALKKQVLASRILLLCLYTLSLPMAYTLSIGFGIGVKALFMGFAIGQAINSLLYLGLVLKTDWQEVFEMNREEKRIKDEELA